MPSSSNVFGNDSTRDTDHYQSVRRSQRVAAMTPTKFPAVVIPSSSIHDSPRQLSPSARLTLNRSNYARERVQHQRELLDSSAQRAEQRLKEFWLIGQETPSGEERRSTIFDETPGHLQRSSDNTSTGERRRRRSKSLGEQSAPWVARWWFVTVPLLLVLAIVKFIFLSVWQLGLPLLKGIFRALRTAMKQSTAPIDHVMTPNRRKRQESPWNKLLYAIVFVVATMLAVTVGRVAIRVHKWWTPEAYLVDKKMALRGIVEEQAGLRRLAENLNDTMEDKFRRSDKTVDALRSSLGRLDSHVNTQLAHVEKSMATLKTLFEEHMTKGNAPRNLSEQVKGEVQRAMRMGTLGTVQDGALTLDPLFGEYLKDVQESQLDVIEARIESALQDRRLQSLVNVTPSATTHAGSIQDNVGPPALPNYALVGLGARVLEKLSSSVYSPCTSVGCKLQQVLTQRHLSGLAPQIVFKSNLEPTMCWSFAGHEGKLTIMLGSSVMIDSISIGHVPGYAVSGGRSSAPRVLEIYALNSRGDDKDAKLLGTGVYELSGPPYQTFPLKPTLARVLQLRIRSNHGNEKYTCLYRILVHGDPSKLIGGEEAAGGRDAGSATVS